MADYEEEEEDGYYAHEEPAQATTRSADSEEPENQEAKNVELDDPFSSDSPPDHVTSRDYSEERHDDSEVGHATSKDLPPDSPFSDNPFESQSDNDEQQKEGRVKRPHPQVSDDEEVDDELPQKRVHLEEEEEEHGEGDDDEPRERGESDTGKKEEIDQREDRESDVGEEQERESGEQEDEDQEGDVGEQGEEQESETGEQEDDEQEGGDLNDDEQNELEMELFGLEPQEEEEAVQRSSDKRESSDSDVEDKKEVIVSDFDLMMQRRKEAMAKARRKRRKDIDVTTNDDHIMAMIRQMKEAAEDDRRLNLQQKAATKKLQMLPTVLGHLKKADLLTSFIECGICSALADWLKPLPDHSLPNIKIRDGILDTLRMFPTLDGHILKTSGLGKSVMLLYRHPKETKKNREKAGKLINNWARPVFGLTSDFKALSRDEREERDWAHLSQAARRRLSSDTRETDQTAHDESEAQKPGDKGWIGRARVPLPSHRDYVVRPKWNKQHEFSKGSGKKALNRYEKQVQKKRETMMRGKNTHAVSISVEGRKMPL